MKSKFRYIFLVALLSMVAACSEDIMDLKDPNNFSLDTYYKSPAEIVMGANAVYASFYFNRMMGYQWPEIWDVLGNESFATSGALGSGDEVPVIAIMLYQHNNANQSIAGMWRMFYKMILRANLVIDKGKLYVAEKGENALVSRSIGEAYFLRGWAYSELAFYYGRVPIRTEFDQAGKEDAPRAETVDAVWAIAESDFKQAQLLLPEASSYSATDKGRASKGSATGFLGKLYLYTKKYDLAEIEFVKMTTQYSLLPLGQYMDNFGETNENNIESVFEVQFAAFTGQKFDALFGGMEANARLAMNTMSPQLYSWVDWPNWKFQPMRENDFVYNNESNIQTIDPRAKFTFYGGLGDMTWCDECATGIKTYDFAKLGYFYKKKINREKRPNENSAFSGNNLRLMRYADVLLMRAECKLETDDTQGCISFINLIRARVGAFQYYGTYSKIQAFELLKRERLIEFMGEGSRYNDLKRWRILKETLNPEFQLIYGKTPVQDIHYMFPIPQLELDTNLKFGTVDNNWN